MRFNHTKSFEGNRKGKESAGSGGRWVMGPTQEWPYSQQVSSVQIYNETAHESIVSLKATQQRVYFIIMRRVLKEWKENVQNKGRWKNRPQGLKEQKWTIINDDMWPPSVWEPQNTSPGQWKSVLRSTFAGAAGDNQQHPFSLHIPGNLSAKHHPMQRISAYAEWHHRCLHKGTLVSEESAPCAFTCCICWAFPSAPDHSHQLGRHQLLSPTQLPSVTKHTEIQHLWNSFNPETQNWNRSFAWNTLKRNRRSWQTGSRRHQLGLAVLRPQIKWLKVAIGSEQEDINTKTPPQIPTL